MEFDLLLTLLDCNTHFGSRDPLHNFITNQLHEFTMDQSRNVLFVSSYEGESTENLISLIKIPNHSSIVL